MSIKNIMLSAILLAAAAFTTMPAQSQVNFGVGVGPVGVEVGEPPVCPYGYYDYEPYACAPIGFWGPEYFYNGIFVGVGPWFGWGHAHGWGEHRFSGHYTRGERGHGEHGGFRGGNEGHGEHGGFRGGNEGHGGGRSGGEHRR